MTCFSFRAWGRGLLFAMLLSLAGVLPADEVTDWHEHMLVALVKGGGNSQVRSRNAAHVSAAVFDAVNGVERRYEPIHVPPGAARGASKRAAAVQAAYAILLSKYPAQADELSAKRTASLAAIGDEGGSIRRGLEWGQTVADAILAWRNTDGFTPTPPAYTGGTETGRWRPTPPAFTSGAVPQFATMTPWAILAPGQFLPPGPPDLESEAYAADYNEVKLMGNATSPLRSADQTDACLFWESGSPTLIWDRVALDLAADRGFELSDNARLLASLNLAVADGLIACWNAKYTYEFWRPVTAIPLGDTDGNDDTAADASWMPLLPTPSHPEYVSGHSSASSAATTVLAYYFGDDTPFVAQSPAAASWMRSFPSFSSAIDEIADARVFAGFHFRTACEDGKTVGSAAAEFILLNRMQRAHGEGE